MNEATRWRYALAQRIAASYARNPNAQVVMIAGSVGRGVADHFSDIEIDVYYAEPPTEAERRAAVEGSGGVLEGLDEDEDEWEEQMNIGGVHAATSTFLIATMERYLHAVVDQAEIAPTFQTRLSSLQRSVTFTGPELVKQWRGKAALYPRELTYAMLHKNLPFTGFWYAEEMFAARNDAIALYEIFVNIERQLIHALLGLNQIYLMTPERIKWMDELIAEMQIKPVDLSVRFKHAFRTEPSAGVRILKNLIEETLSLVETHVPELDTAPYRANIVRQRPAWDAPPASVVALLEATGNTLA